MNYPMTKNGERALKEQLQFLQEKERPRIAEALHKAASLGDLSENAEYDSAKRDQENLEIKIAKINERLNNAQVIDPSQIKDTDKVTFGATVTLLNLDNEKEITITIVGEDEADLSKGLIAYNSPTARACIGKNEGDIIEVQAPAGVIEYEITQIHYNLD